MKKILWLLVVFMFHALPSYAVDSPVFGANAKSIQAINATATTITPNIGQAAYGQGLIVTQTSTGTATANCGSLSWGKLYELGNQSSYSYSLTSCPAVSSLSSGIWFVW